MQQLENLTISIKHVQLQRTSLNLYPSCPGLYCGRIVLPTTQLSECGACPRGTRSINSICTPCPGDLTPYAWMYLAFMGILPLIVHLTVIDMIFCKSRTKTYSILQISAILEAISAGFLTVMLFRYDDEFKIKYCGSDHLTDWYSLFYNPKPDHIHTMHCTHEVVYPLYSMVFVYYFFSLIFMLTCRTAVAKWTWSNMSRNALLAGLYQYPLLLGVHACCAGLLYFIFPHVIVIVSSITSAVHCAVAGTQTFLGLLKSLFTSIHSLLVVIIHWLFLGFGIFAIYHTQSVKEFLLISPTILAPMVVYLTTVRLSEPKKYYDQFD